VAELAAADGDVRWQRVAGGAWTRVASGKRLRPAEAVQTMGGAHATVTLPRGGASAELGPLTTLRIPEQPPELRRMSNLRGDAEGHAPSRWRWTASRPFSSSALLRQGLTDVVVGARDPAGNVRTVSRLVVRP
jgi:hypothetical protein